MKLICRLRAVVPKAVAVVAGLAASVVAVPTTARGQSAIIYGSLGNFDISNDTGRICHGFEVELEGLTPFQVPYSFTAQRYGAPSVISYATGVRVRWASPFDADRQQWVERTLPHTVPWFPGQCYQWNPATYQDSGCEHFGVGATANPTRARARWLCEDSSNPGVLVPVDPPTAVPMPNYYVAPPARAGDPPQLIVEVDAPEPAEAPSLYGDAQWMRVFVTQLPYEVTLDELMADNPAVVPMDPAQLESDYSIIQDEPVAGGNGRRRRKQNRGDLLPTTRSVVRRIELYEFTGDYDPVTHEAMCADLTCAAPAADEIGGLISMQMSAAIVQSDSVTVTKTGNGNVESDDKRISCGNKCVAPYNAGTLVTLRAKAASGSVFSGWTGACTGLALTCTVNATGHVDVGASFSAAPSGGGGGGGGGTATVLPDIQVSGSASTGKPAPGAEFSYTFQVKNGGSASASAVVFNDVLPAELPPPSYSRAVTSDGSACNATSSAGGALTVSCALGPMAAGTQKSITIFVVAPPTSSTFVNTGTATSGSGDKDLGNNSKSVSVSVR